MESEWVVVRAGLEGAYPMGGTRLWAEPGELVSGHMGAWRDRQGAGPSQGLDQGRPGGVARRLTWAPGTESTGFCIFLFWNRARVGSRTGPRESGSWYALGDRGGQKVLPRLSVEGGKLAGGAAQGGPEVLSC